MPYDELLNGETKRSFRSKLNTMLTEIYADLVSGLTFLGILNNGDPVEAEPEQGDYYLINEADTYGGVACQAFDGLYYNGTAWQLLSGAMHSYTEKQTQADGISDSMPIGPEDTEITHILSLTYVDAPEVSLQSYCDWHLYVKSVTIKTGVVTVTIGIGSSGSASTITYTLLALR